MIQVESAKVYRSPRAGRRYFSLAAAVNAEARAIIKAKYPDERAEYDSGHITYPGFHWVTLPRSEVMYRRLARLVRAEFLAKEPT